MCACFGFRLRACVSVVSIVQFSFISSVTNTQLNILKNPCSCVSAFCQWDQASVFLRQANFDNNHLVIEQFFHLIKNFNFYSNYCRKVAKTDTEKLTWTVQSTKCNNKNVETFKSENVAYFCDQHQLGENCPPYWIFSMNIIVSKKFELPPHKKERKIQ